MSVDIIVKRLDADDDPHKGEDVVEPLLGSSVEAALARGTAELEELGSGQKLITYDVEYRSGVRNGLIVRLRDSITGDVVHGKIVSVSIAGSRSGADGPFDLSLRIQLRIPTDFVIKPV